MQRYDDEKIHGTRTRTKIYQSCVLVGDGYFGPRQGLVWLSNRISIGDGQSRRQTAVT